MITGGFHLPSSDRHFAAMGDKLADYQREQRDAAFQYVQDWRLAVDLGANIGVFSRHFAMRFEKVIAFEPSSINFDCLVRNVPENVECRRQAVGDSAGTARLHFIRQNVGGAQIIGHPLVCEYPGAIVEEQDVEEVEIVALDSLRLDHVGLIKLDLQGSEEIALRGAMKTLRRCRPVVLIEEKPLGNHEGSREQIRACRKLLTKFAGMVPREKVGADRIYIFED